MDRNNTPDDLIASALSLPPPQRVELMDAIQASLTDSTFDRSSEKHLDDVEAAWKEEVSRRVDEVKHSQVKTIPADEAEKAIRDDGPSSV